MQHTEKKLLEINIFGDNAKEETLKKITDFIEQNPVREKPINHHIVEYRQSVEGSFDIFIDGKKADLKKTKGTGNIRKYAHKAIKHQGADIVVFEFDMNNGIDVQRQIIEIRKEGFKGYYYFTDDRSKLYTI